MPKVQTMIPPRSYLPEIHDVHPGMAPELDRLLAALPAEAQPLALLLVVPNWFGQFPLAKFPKFVERLKNFPGEKVLHGFTHTLGRDWWNTICYGTENHAEFAAPSETVARTRLEQSAKMFADALGEKPGWFCAPRWQQNAATKAALAALGFHGFMLGNRCETLSGRRLEMPAICFDDGGLAWRHAGGRLHRGWLIRRWLAQETPFRLTLHPNDLLDPKTWRQATDFIATLQARGWKPLAFTDALFA
jgi:predicted deacetylase